MITTFSNGFKMDIKSAVESRGSSDASASLALSVNGMIDIEYVLNHIRDGLDIITVENGSDVSRFEGYTKVLSVQNVVSETFNEASIRLAKE